MSLSDNGNGHREEKILEELREINIRLDEQLDRLNEISDDLTYLTELLMRYIKMNEGAKKVDNFLVNTLFFTVGILLGFSIALLMLK